MQDILKELIGISVWTVGKIAILFALSIYILFAVIVVRQVKLMGQTLNGHLNFIIKLVGWIHLLVAIAAFLLALFIL
jgi:hypothetical protein